MTKSYGTYNEDDQRICKSSKFQYTVVDLLGYSDVADLSASNIIDRPIPVPVRYRCYAIMQLYQSCSHYIGEAGPILCVGMLLLMRNKNVAFIDVQAKHETNIIN